MKRIMVHLMGIIGSFFSVAMTHNWWDSRVVLPCESGECFVSLGGPKT